MKDLGYRNAVAVSSLPTASIALAGATVRLTTDDKPYWCNGTSWVDLTASGGTAPGDDGQVQYVSGGALAAATNVEVQDGHLCLIADINPTTPADNIVMLFGKRIGELGDELALPAFLGSEGSSYILQPGLWQQKIARWNPPGNATTVPAVDGLAAVTALGTATARNVATTNALTRTRRLGYVSTATAGNFAGHYSGAAQYTSGNGTIGGFFYSARFGVSDASLQSAARTFVGLTSSTATPTNVSPSTFLNCVGIGHDAGDTNWKLFSGGTIADPVIDLGTDFPINNTDLIEITLWGPSTGNGHINYYVERFNASVKTSVTGYFVASSGGLHTPGNTVLLAHRAWRCNNTAAAAVGIDIASLYIGTRF